MSVHCPVHPMTDRRTITSADGLNIFDPLDAGHQPPNGEKPNRAKRRQLPAFRLQATVQHVSIRCSASIASIFKPISAAKASSNHHSSGGLGIKVSPEP